MPEPQLHLDADTSSKALHQALLEAHGNQASMNGAGSRYDNAPMGSFFGTLKS